MILCRRIDSPIGPLMLAADEAGLRHIEFRDNRHPVNRGDWHGGDNAILQATEAQLARFPKAEPAAEPDAAPALPPTTSYPPLESPRR